LIKRVPVFFVSVLTNYKNPGYGKTIPILVMAGSISTAATSLNDNYLSNP
jgi:hypothetical protein